MPDDLPSARGRAGAEVYLGRVPRLAVPRGERLRTARDVVYARRVRAGRSIDLTCLRIGPARLISMPGELFVEYQLEAQRLAAENGAPAELIGAMLAVDAEAAAAKDNPQRAILGKPLLRCHVRHGLCSFAELRWWYTLIP